MPIIGFACGLGLASVAFVAWRVPEGRARLDAQLTLTATRSGPLGVSPTGTILSGVDLRPGHPGVSTRIELRDQTAETLVVRFRVAGGVADLDRLVRVEARTDTSVVYDGLLGGLRDWTAAPLVLASAHTATLTLRAWLPGSVRDDYQGRVVNARLELATQATDT